MTRFLPARKATLLSCALLLAWTAGATAQNRGVGEEEYRFNCAGCHGADGKGGGPVAQFLKIEVPDLTTLRERIDGRFPFTKVIAVIDGRGDVRGHGDRDMPVWEARFSSAVGPDYRSTDPAATEEIVRGRILNWSTT